MYSETKIIQNFPKGEALIHMKEFSISPKILFFDTCEEYFGAVDITESDLLITSRHTFDDYLKKYFERATTVFIRDFGSGEPTDVMADNISRSISGTAYRRVFAVGGGTVLDMAKLFALKNHCPAKKLFCGETPCEKEKELILVPTTCGTGSEVTNISILELTGLGTKKGLAHDALYADKAVLIPELLESLPFGAFAASSADALIHGIESFLSPKATDISQMFSVKAIKDIIEGYIYIAENGENSRKDVLKELLTASACAGIAFGNAGCGAVHALSYPLGAVCHVPHGVSNYIMLGGVLEKYREKQCGEAFEKLCGIIGELLGCESGEALAKLDSLMGKLLERKRLSAFGLDDNALCGFASSVIKNQQRLLSNAPTELSESDITDIYRNLF